jgi:hypothetical protein
VIDGMINDFNPDAVKKPVDHQPISIMSPRPKVGNHLRITPNNKIRRMPIRNVGSDTPINEIVIKVYHYQHF